MSDTIIKIDGLWKRYGLPPTAGPGQLLSNLRHLRNPFWTDPDQGPWSLRDVSLEIKRGEVFGIIGRNGAGKSTLLKILAGVSKPTRGSVEVKGRIFPMIELNAGMHFDLSGRENVRLLGAVMGLTKRQIRMVEPDVEEFCELGEYFDMPVRTYSSGMLARLGFGVAMNIRADILLVDEVLSVGDYVFQKKAIDRMDRLIMSGVTVILVSHSPYVIERMCSKSLLMDGGKVSLIGKPSAVNYIYFSMKTKKEKQGSSIDADYDKRAGSGDVRITKVIVTGEVYSNRKMEVMVDFIVKEEATDPGFTLTILDSLNTVVSYFSNLHYNKGIKLAKGTYRYRINIERLPLMPGSYFLSFGVTMGAYRCDIFPNAAEVDVLPDPDVQYVTAGLGIAYIESRWEIE